MKRTIEFQILDDKYSFKENDVEIFEVNKQEYQIDVKQFYNAFFANGKDYSEIEFDVSLEMTNDDRRVFDAISKLIENICTRLKSELITVAYNSNCHESTDSYKMLDH